MSFYDLPIFAWSETFFYQLKKTSYLCSIKNMLCFFIESIDIMSSYRFRLNNYHAISSADIAIDGLTVLSGINGCGTSTISRWLYYLVNGSLRYENFVYKRYINTLLAFCREYDRARHEMNFDDNYNYAVHIKNGTEKNTYQSPLFFQRVELKNRYNEEGAELTTEYYTKFVDDFSNRLEGFLAGEVPDTTKKRVLRYLNINADFDGNDILQYSSVNDFREVSKNVLQKALQQRTLDLKKRPIPLLFEFVRDVYEDEIEEPTDMDLTEDGVSIIEGDRLAVLLGLRRAIYVDTPLALRADASGNRFWEELKNYMGTKIADIDIEGKKLLRRVKDTLQGEVRFVKSDSPFDTGELHFFSADNSVEIGIDDTATGFKTFIYLQRLIENGHLDEETLFLLDEPEVHLHPQWIVEYAKLLVLLHKKLGVKIVLATHNPDMVAAIQSIAEREMILDRTHFYIAEPGQNQGTFMFKDLGSGIEEIFSSFNIALERIAMYGGSYLR